MTDPTAKPGPVERAHGGDGKFIRTVEGAERDAEAARLRTDGLSYRAIGERLGIDKPSAWHAVQRALKEIVREPAEELQALELERLDIALAAVMAVLRREHVTVSNGKVIYVGESKTPLLDDAPVLAAVDRLVKISESRRKLLGLDSPTRLDVSGGVRYEVVGVDLEQLT